MGSAPTNSRGLDCASGADRECRLRRSDVRAHPTPKTPVSAAPRVLDPQGLSDFAARRSRERHSL